MIGALGEYITVSWLYYGLMIVYGLTIISIIIVVLSENRNPVKSLAWITVLLLLPLVGIILYIFFGRSIKNTHMISRRNRRRLKRQETYRTIKYNKLGLSDASLRQIQLARSLTGAPYYPGNTVEIFTEGRSKFDTLIADLRSARRFINLEYYIFEDDEIGTSIRDVLIERARAGVKVRVVYDHVGSFQVRNRFFKEMRQAQVQAYPFFKVSFPPFGTRINWRNHRKICIIDGEIGYIGGMNIADRYIDGGKFPLWRDTHLRIAGPAVSALQFSFAVDWNFMGQPLIEDEMPQTMVESGNAGLQLLVSGPTSQWTNIALLFLKAITSATHRVYIQTPYFLPSDGLLKALQTAALSGVDVRIMMPIKSDSAMLTAASASYITECLQAGVKIYFYTAGMLHAKTLITDDEFVSIGSTNFDFRSFEHNFEANMQIYSFEINNQMVQIFRQDLQKCVRVNPAEWKKRPLIKKAIESVIRLMSPIL